MMAVNPDDAEDANNVAGDADGADSPEEDPATSGAKLPSL